MVSEKTIHDLIHKNGDIFITITLPTHKTGEGTKQDPIRFKNLLTEVSGKLQKRGMKDPQIQALLKPARELLEKPLFWSHAEQGLAVYISNDQFDVYKLPYRVEPQVYVNDHFLITPLLPMTSMDGVFCVLALSRQNVRLLKCTRNETQDITPDDAPVSVSDYLEIDPEKQLQFHTGASGQNAMYFGHGASEEDKMIIVEQFFRELEKEVTALMREMKTPLVLAGLKENTGLYAKINSFSRLMENTVDINPSDLSDKDLRNQGWEVIKKYFLSDMYHSLESFSGYDDTRISNNLSEIVEATVMGKSQTIFISSGEKKWGVYDPENHTVHYSSNPGNGDVELLNWLSIKAHKTGSKVYMLPKEEMPMHSTVAAEYRF